MFIVFFVVNFFSGPEVPAVQGILTYFEIPELALASGAKRVTWMNPLDRNEAPLGEHSFVNFTREVIGLEKVFKFAGKTDILRR